MDRKLDYNVWMRNGNSYAPVLNTPVSQVTAEALAMLMSNERYCTPMDSRFVVSVGKPSSGGFPVGENAVGGFVLNHDADRAIRHAVNFQRSVENFEPGISYWHLLQDAGLVNHKGFATEKGKAYVDGNPAVPKPR